MRKLIALCCLLGILTLSACAPTGQPADTTTTDTTTTTTIGDTTTTWTDDSAWSDTDWGDDFILPDDTYLPDEGNDDYDDIFNSDLSLIYEEVPAPDNAAQLPNPQKGGADAEAEALRQKILNAENSEYTITGTTYYVSPNGDDYNDGTSPETAWRTVEAVVMNRYLFQKGDAVLFERGGIYRRNTTILAKEGVTYGAYGEGDKPVIYGSISNYAWGTRWEPSFKENVWKITLHTGEAGNIVFNHGEEVGMPYYHGLNELTKNGDFYHNTDDATLYLYLDKGYPSTVYKDIEIGTRETIVQALRDTTDVTVDNLCLKYVGLFAFSAKENTRNIRVTNCEMGWIGGGRFAQSKVGLGNAISFWKDTTDALVENCWLYQCYDAGITPQGVTEEHTYKNLVFRGNLIEFCNYSIECFDRVDTSVWDGLVIEDNIMRFSGYGFMKAWERPDSQIGVGHFVGWTWNYQDLPGDGVVIRNNIFDCSARNLVFWSGKDYTSGLTVSGNSFYQSKNRDNQAMRFGDHEPYFATNQEELETAVRAFDPTAKVIKWLDK